VCAIPKNIFLHRSYTDYSDYIDSSELVQFTWQEMGTDNDINLDQTNISMDNAIQCAGIYLYSPSLCTSSHCTFSNNKVGSCISIHFDSTIGTISMSYSNTIHNSSPYLGIIYIKGEGTKMMMYIITKNNNDYLFNVSSGSLELSHSFICHSTHFSKSITIPTANNSFEYIETYQIHFFSSLHCHADIPNGTSAKSQEIFSSHIQLIVDYILCFYSNFYIERLLQIFFRDISLKTIYNVILDEK